MKRYLLFASLHYYPTGGWHDYIDSFDLVDEAITYFKENRIAKQLEWFHVVDSKNREIICNSIQT